MERPFALSSLALALFALTACGGSGATRPPRTVELEETRIVAHQGAGGEIETELYDANTLFERAFAMTETDCPGAVALYDRIASEFPTSRFVASALYNAGLCLQHTGQLREAVTRYTRLLEAAPSGRDPAHARLQILTALVDLEDWQGTLEAAEALLLRDDLDLGDRLEGMARRAQALLGLRRIDDAARAARDTLTFYRTRTSEPLDPYFAAAANFVLAETFRARSEALELPNSDVVTQRETLDRRAQLLLDAQRAYFDTIRFTDARWAAAAGYRIGSMYEELYRALTTAPVPPPPREMTESQLVLYQAEYRRVLADRVRPLVRHAIRYWELTLLMVERTGVRSEWVERTRAQLDQARGLLLTGESTIEPHDAARALGSPAPAPTPVAAETPPSEPEPPSTHMP